MVVEELQLDNPKRPWVTTSGLVVQLSVLRNLDFVLCVDIAFFLFVLDINVPALGTSNLIQNATF